LATTMFLVTPPAREEEEPLLGEPLTVSLIWILRRIATEEGSKETLDKKLISNVWAYAWDTSFRSNNSN
jgi:hypothetical protein